MFFQTRYNLYRKICNHKTVKSMEIMMGEILNLTENTFHINKSIHDNDWEKFCYFTLIQLFIHLISFQIHQNFQMKLINFIIVLNVENIINLLKIMKQMILI